MADNVTIDNGALTDFDAATDDVGGKHYQRVKIDVGGDGASVPVEGELPVVQTEPTTTGTLGALSATISMPTNGMVGVVFVSETDGDLVGTVVMEGSSDGGSTWYNYRGLLGSTGGARLGVPANIDGADFFAGNYAFGWSLHNVGDQYVTHLRLRVSAYTSGSASVRATALRNVVWNQDGIPAVRLVGLDNEALPSDSLGLNVSRQAAATTATLANVAGSASSVTLQASNSGRRGLTIWNDSSAILYVKLGTTASTTSCTVKMVADAYYEVPFGYTGRVDGIWASATGSARMTELT